MNIERLISKNYYQSREILQNKMELPSVNLYSMCDENDREEFVKKLMNLPDEENLSQWTDTYPESFFIEALKRGYLIDTFPFQLADRAKTCRSGRFADPKKAEKLVNRYVDLYDTWENGTVVEYPWRLKGRFVRVLDEDAFYETAFSRNRFVISKEAQEKIRKTTFAIAGMSVGGSIGYLLVLTGAQNFIIADGGKRDLHDTNRIIGGDVASFGKNQAVEWAKTAYSLNPYLNLTCHPRNLDVEGGEQPVILIDDFIRKADSIIEAVDNLGIKAALRQKSDGKTIYMGTDLGLGAKADRDLGMFHGKLSPEQINLLNDPNISHEDKTNLAVLMIGIEHIPRGYFRAVQESLQERTGFWPQPGTAAFLSAAMIVGEIILDVSGHNVRDETSIDLEKILLAE